MSAVFNEIYLWFCGMYSGNLDTFLYGTGEGANYYTSIGLITLAVSLVVVLLYYYVFQHPRYSRWWSWLLTMILNGVISMFIAAGFALSQLNNGAMGELSDNIFPFDCWMFGVANLLVSFIFYIVFTFTLKWWSRDAKHVPFF